MNRTIQYLWLIPVIPLLAAGATALLPRRFRGVSAAVAVGSLGLSFVLSCGALLKCIQLQRAGVAREVANFGWLQFGDTWLRLGWVLDPLSVLMLVMISFVGLLIFVYSIGYMSHDPNFTRFFCFLSLFAAAMLGLVLSNSLLLLFICWELVGLTSYLLIGFWFQKPAAAAAAKKAFITTRIGDLALLLGLLWLYARTGTLLFYDDGLNGCLELGGLGKLVLSPPVLGIAACTGIGLLIFAGAAGKSGQLPLHVWLPDAMEGPTPVSALIHAATMVAAGVFLVARVYPLMALNPQYVQVAGQVSTVLRVVTWVGVLTALFAATIAVAQTDIKRILAYSTVSQLGFMMLGLGTGGVAVGMFHLVMHAFFKALLFLGAGSVIHGSHDEQDIRFLGGLRRHMPVTFATYAAGMLALSGFPLLFSGFWSKDEILHAAHTWPASHWPFYLGVAAALLTAFYMTRQVCYVFLGRERSRATGPSHHPHESPAVMTVPLVVLAACSILLGFLGTPAWPWFQGFISGRMPAPNLRHLVSGEVLSLMAVSTVVVLAGIAVGLWLYGPRRQAAALEPDVLERLWPNVYGLWQRKYFVDEAYEWSLVRLNAWIGRSCDLLERWVFEAVVELASYWVIGVSWLNRFLDEYIVNLGFDFGCRRLLQNGRFFSRLQRGFLQNYIQVVVAGVILLVLLMLWGFRS